MSRRATSRSKAGSWSSLIRLLRASSEHGRQLLEHHGRGFALEGETEEELEDVAWGEATELACEGPAVGDEGRALRLVETGLPRECLEPGQGQLVAVVAGVGGVRLDRGGAVRQGDHGLGLAHQRAGWLGVAVAAQTDRDDERIARLRELYARQVAFAGPGDAHERHAFVLGERGRDARGVGAELAEKVGGSGALEGVLLEVGAGGGSERRLADAVFEHVEHVHALHLAQEGDHARFAGVSTGARNAPTLPRASRLITRDFENMMARHG